MTRLRSAMHRYRVLTNPFGAILTKCLEETNCAKTCWLPPFCSAKQSSWSTQSVRFNKRESTMASNRCSCNHPPNVGRNAHPSRAVICGHTISRERTQCTSLGCYIWHSWICCGALASTIVKSINQPFNQPPINQSTRTQLQSQQYDLWCAMQLQSTAPYPCTATEIHRKCMCNSLLIFGQSFGVPTSFSLLRIQICKPL